ncbi:hypothetical protein VitviT2T_030134 [Vitis vinifera]|uniref:WPP domain-interacting protein 1 n=2 Tax=Vitis vinifera TaxID=29760 RepID=A0ABY9E202_VITVI|nr:WPP domain-interacting protein 2 [Vitis vinifera]WKA12779.1 hypothetical protein VitviT2T_030134 [Vitis vinifera]|eukprot:XP_002265097.1 PREDICTED: WPP domain-interacting protein 2 [Vitis vinifera]
MDLGRECLGHEESESIEDNELNPDRISLVEDTKINNNGSCAIEKVSSGGEFVDANVLAPDAKGKDDQQIVEPLDSPSTVPTKSPGLFGGSNPTTKGYGLKKWRRIRRDFVKDSSVSVDSSKMLKRGLSGSLNPAKPPYLSEIKQNSEGSVGSANILVKNSGVNDHLAAHASSSDSRFAVGSTFTAGTDSENSEDRSSKSSTAASAPKARHDMNAVLGHARDKNRMKNLSGKSSGNSIQRVQQGKPRTETSKKPRGERVKIEKENSHSSMESDSRSSNFVFMQGNFSANSNGKQSGTLTNYDGENSDEAQAGEKQFGEELQTGYSKETVGEVEDLSLDDLAADLPWEVKEEKGETDQPLIDQDPLVDSILALQSVQEALEREVQKFGEIAKEPISVCNSSIKDSSSADFASMGPEIHEASSSCQLSSEETRQSDSCFMETQMHSLKQNISSLESKLEEATAMLKVKEYRIVELEESGSAIELQQKQCREMETELEDLFKQKIEAEVEYLTLTRTIQKLRAGDQIMIYEEQKALAGEQAQMLNKLGEAEGKAAMLKKQAEKLETYCGDILGSEEVMKMEKRLCKVTLCFLIQLLLLLAFGLFVFQLPPHSSVVVPT